MRHQQPIRPPYSFYTLNVIIVLLLFIAVAAMLYALFGPSPVPVAQPTAVYSQPAPVVLTAVAPQSDAQPVQPAPAVVTVIVVATAAPPVQSAAPVIQPAAGQNPAPPVTEPTAPAQTGPRLGQGCSLSRGTCPPTPASP